ncbi:MAG: ribonuclease Z [Candidatus Diapherotrites archaeon]
MELTLSFLGTGCSAPTKSRALTGIVLSFLGKNYLFDCPEGAQKRALKAGVSLMKIDAIFFSHFHADHFLGLPGMLATMNMFERDTDLKIFGPRGVKEMVAKALDIAFVNPCYKIECIELRKGTVLEEKDFSIETFPLQHGTPCFGFVFTEKDKLGEFDRKKAIDLGIPIGPLFAKLQEGGAVKLKGKTIKPEQVLDLQKGRKGRKVAIVLDTLPSEKYLAQIKGADLLVHEAVFLDSEKERAKETFHSTALQAAALAKKAGVKKLVLTHFSNRRMDLREVEEEARKEFKESIASQELMELDVPRNPLGVVK